MLRVEFLVNVENVDMQATERSGGEECLPTPGTIYNFVTTSQHLDYRAMDTLLLGAFLTFHWFFMA